MSNENENSEDFASLLRISENQIGFIPAPQLAINNKRISICFDIFHILQVFQTRAKYLPLNYTLTLFILRNFNCFHV